MKKEPNKETIAERIKHIRNTLHLKGKDFAPRIGISGPSLSEVEKGKYYPNFEFIYHMAREYNLNLYYIIYGEGEMIMEPGKQENLEVLAELAASSPDIGRFLQYFQNSEIIRYYILGQFKSKILMEKELIEKELAEEK